MKTHSPKKQHRRLFFQIVGVLLIVATLIGGSWMSRASADAPTAPGCSYGKDGPHSGTICWLNFAAFNETTAGTDTGQPFSISLPGGYNVSFDLTWQKITSDYPPYVSATPTWSGSAFGNTVYTGVQGKPALGSEDGTIRYMVKNVHVTDPTGATVTGYSLISMDAEAMVGGEGELWRSDQPLNLLAEAPTTTSYYGCATPTGLGTTEVNCPGGQDGAPIVFAKNASWISADVTGGGSQDVVFGMEFANIEVNTAFNQLYEPTDSVNATIATPQGSTIGSSSSAGALTATTGSVTVLPVGQLTLSEIATPGTSTLLDWYDAKWSCTNVNANGVSGTVLPSGSALTQVVTPIAGDDVVCTVNYTLRKQPLPPPVNTTAPVNTTPPATTIPGPPDTGLLHRSILTRLAAIVVGLGLLISAIVVMHRRRLHDRS